MHDNREDLLEHKLVAETRIETGAQQHKLVAETRIETGAQQHKLVAIITESRSGSSWLGSLFELSDDILYVFEPLHPRGDHEPLHYTLNSDETLDVLSQLCTCSFAAKLINAFGWASQWKRIRSIAKYNLSK